MVKFVLVDQDDTQTPDVITHDGKFHCDELVAISLIAAVTQKETLTILRTRDTSQFKRATWVVDVGGIYDMETKRFDHHQREFDCRNAYGEKYSSAGLVLNYFKQQQILETEVAEKIYNRVIRYVDAIDNGLSLGENYSLSHAVSTFASVAKDLDQAFLQTLQWVFSVVDAEIESANQYAINYAHWLKCIEASQHEPNLIILDSLIVNWLEFPCPQEKKFVIFPEAQNSGYRVQAIPKDTPFSMRKPLPESWAGLRDQDLAKVTGLKSAVFCHVGRFIAGFTKLEDAIQAGKIAALK